MQLQLAGLNNMTASKRLYYLFAFLFAVIIGVSASLDQYWPIFLLLTGLLGALILFIPTTVIYLLFGISLLSPPHIPTIITFFGHIEVKVHDLLFLMAFVVIIFAQLANKKTSLTRMPKAFWKIFIFLYVLAFSLANVASRYPDRFVTSAISFLKYFVYFLIAFLVVVFLRTKDELSRGFMVFAGMAALLILLAPLYGVEGPTSTSYFGTVVRLLFKNVRSGSLVGDNPLGLISGLLVCLSFVQFRRPKINSCFSEPVLFVLGGLGFLGLWYAKSLSAALGLGVALLIELIWQGKENIVRFVVSGFLVIFLTALAFFAVLMRGELPGLLALTGGSWAHRLVQGAAGFFIFASFPLFGCGWQSSSIAAYDPKVLEPLFKLFPKLPYYYFPSPAGAGVHNAYIQVLAELGILGALAFLYVVAMIVKFSWKVLESTKGQGSAESMARLSFLGIVYVLIWLNTNGLFGGLPEQALLWFFFGSLIAISKIAGRRNDCGDMT